MYITLTLTNYRVVNCFRNVILGNLKKYFFNSILIKKLRNIRNNNFKVRV